MTVLEFFMDGPNLAVRLSFIVIKALLLVAIALLIIKTWVMPAIQKILRHRYLIDKIALLRSCGIDTISDFSLPEETRRELARLERELYEVYGERVKNGKVEKVQPILGK